jgi:8-amino-7-oxononanoate synthase
MHPRERIEYRVGALRVAGQWREPERAEEDARAAAAGAVDARSNDYLGLGARVVSRETQLAGRVGAGASRLISGTHAEHVALERELADWQRTEAALVFSSGYAANVGAISALAGPGETVLSDALNHASLIDGCRLSRASVVVLPHADLGALERALADVRGVCWVVTESYFGMDADVPDLRGVRRLCDAAGAALVVDEAHALGVFGPEGRGACADQGVVPDLLIGGMGKALGVQGGFVACSRLFRGWLWNRSRSFVFSTAPSPVICTLAREQLLLLRRADRERTALRALEARFVDRLLSGGVELSAARRGPIFPIVFGGEAAVMRASAMAAELGVLCHPIRPPTVPAGSSRLRVSLRADMSEADVDLVASAVVRVWEGARSARDGERHPGALEPSPAASTLPDHPGKEGERHASTRASHTDVSRPESEGARTATAIPAAVIAGPDGKPHGHPRDSGSDRREPEPYGPGFRESAFDNDRRAEASHRPVTEARDGPCDAQAIDPQGSGATVTPGTAQMQEARAGVRTIREPSLRGAEAHAVAHESEVARGQESDWRARDVRPANPEDLHATVAGPSFARPANPPSPTIATRSRGRYPTTPVPVSHRWVVLGTGTGIGKTFAATALVRLLARDGLPVAGLKPIETGLAEGEARGDAAMLAAASLGVPLPPTHPLYAFDEPITPSRAARAASRRIELPSIVTWVRDVESGAPAGARLVIETAGGVFSPLEDGVSNFDLARALDPALWVLVAPDRLGVLHDVGSCLLAMDALGRRPDYVVLSAPERADTSTGTNREELARNPRTPPIIDLPRNDPDSLRALLTLSGEPGRAR